MVEKISSIVEALFKEEEYLDYFLVEVKMNKHSKKVDVFIDGDNGVSFGICKKTSRAIEAYLDEQHYNEGKYTLDVSSAGVDNPLKLYRQYKKNVGRDIKVLTTERETIKGVLKHVDEKGIVVYTSKKKKKELIEKEFELLFEQIKTAKILTKI